MAAAADEVGRAAGFGGRIRMRNWPMDCDRVVIAAGRSGAVPSYFDSGVAGLGASPLASLGAGFARVEENEPVLVDIEDMSLTARAYSALARYLLSGTRGLTICRK